MHRASSHCDECPHHARVCRNDRVTLPLAQLELTLTTATFVVVFSVTSIVVLLTVVGAVVSVVCVLVRSAGPLSTVPVLS